jgi:hypothetical protein
MKRTSSGLIIVASLGGVVGLLAGACKKDAPTILAESASVLSAATAPPNTKATAYAIDTASKTSIDMPGLKEDIKADTDAAIGKLDVDLTNLANTRGEVKVDLTTLKTHTFNDDSKDPAQTAHARNWLEVGDKATDDVKKANQYAVYAIQTVDNLSATDVSKVASVKEGGEDIRTVTATTHGEFLIHGHKTKKDAPIEARFHYAAGAGADAKPTRIDIKTTAPLHVTLKEHDVRPRDNFGKLADWTSNLISKVADTADVSLDLHATLTNP